VSTLDTCIGVELCEELFTPARSVTYRNSYNFGFVLSHSTQPSYLDGFGRRGNIYQLKRKPPRAEEII
jgi:hypothetical protein